MIRHYLRRTMHSPRWQFAHDWLAPFVANPDSNQWLRYVMDRQVETLVTSIGPSDRDALEISGTKWRRDGYFRNYRTVDYPEFDICRDQLPARFDLVIAEQVFEHILWPYRAGKNVYAMLNPGGAFLITTPFMIKIHEHPVDCSRWTETGIRCLLHECGFPEENIVTGSWGNRACVEANLKQWQVYRPWRHSLKNESEYPVMVWALARK